MFCKYISLFIFGNDTWVTLFQYNLNLVYWTTHGCRSKTFLQSPNVCQIVIIDSLLSVFGEDPYLEEDVLVSCCIQTCTLKQWNMLYLFPQDTSISIKITLCSPDGFCSCSFFSPFQVIEIDHSAAWYHMFNYCIILEEIMAVKELSRWKE